MSNAYDTPAGKAITEAMSQNPYNAIPVRDQTDEQGARSTAFDLYLLNEREVLMQGGEITADADTLVAGAQAWADDFWGEYA